MASPHKEVNGVEQAGKVYVYRRSGNGLILIRQETDPNPDSYRRFGKGLCLKEGWLFVGAPHPVASGSYYPGSVYAYRIDNNNVTYHSMITASEIETNQFGSSIDFRNGVLLVGAPSVQVYGVNRHGKAYAFSLVNNQFVEQAILVSRFNDDLMALGTSVALTEQYAVAGSPNADLSERKDNGRLFFFSY